MAGRRGNDAAERQGTLADLTPGGDIALVARPFALEVIDSCARGPRALDGFSRAGFHRASAACHQDISRSSLCARAAALRTFATNAATRGDPNTRWRARSPIRPPPQPAASCR